MPNLHRNAHPCVAQIIFWLHVIAFYPITKFSTNGEVPRRCTCNHILKTEVLQILARHTPRQPVISVANVVQLATDFLIASLSLDRAGIFDPTVFVPVIVIRGDGLPGMTTPLECMSSWLSRGRLGLTTKDSSILPRRCQCRSHTATLSSVKCNEADTQRSESAAPWGAFGVS